MIDTCIVVRELEEMVGKKRICGLYIVKSRGTDYFSDVHKLILSDAGISVEPMGTDSISTSDPKTKSSTRITVKSKE